MASQPVSSILRQHNVLSRLGRKKIRGIIVHNNFRWTADKFREPDYDVSDITVGQNLPDEEVMLSPQIGVIIRKTISDVSCSSVRDHIAGFCLAAQVKPLNQQAAASRRRVKSDTTRAGVETRWRDDNSDHQILNRFQSTTQSALHQKLRHPASSDSHHNGFISSAITNHNAPLYLSPSRQSKLTPAITSVNDSKIIDPMSAVQEQNPPGSGYFIIGQFLSKYVLHYDKANMVRIWLDSLSTGAVHGSYDGLVWPLSHLLSNISSEVTLLPGDIVFPGSPVQWQVLSGNEPVSLGIEDISSLSLNATQVESSEA